MQTISLIIFIIMIYEILKILVKLFSKKMKRIRDFEEIYFKESIKYYVKTIHFVGIVILFALSSFSSEFIIHNFLPSFILFSIVSIIWLYIHLTKRLIITKSGIGHLSILNLVISFVNWEDIEFANIQKTEVTLYLKTKEKIKYSISLTNSELNEMQSYLPSNINKYIFKI